MTNPMLLRRLYRSLLKAAKPFSSPSEQAVVFNCLLHRSGLDDGLDWDFDPQDLHSPSLRSLPTKRSHPRSLEDARDLSKSYADDEDDEDDLPEPFRQELEERRAPHKVLFRLLLREVVTGGQRSVRQMQNPADVDTSRLQSVIRREFREPSSRSTFDDATRQEVAFVALRELNKKISWAEGCNDKNSSLLLGPEEMKERNRRQAAQDVNPLPLKPPSAYLQPGAYLIAHPLMDGYFRRTVVCILDHSDPSSKNNSGGTYGLIVNRVGVSPAGKRRTLREILRTLPPDLATAFGNCTVKEGGPVHSSLQMVHARTPEQVPIGGTVLTQSTGEDVASTAMNTDRAIYYQGNIMEAADAVINGDLDRDDVSFYVGASCWSLGQLEYEIERGYWLPCSGPPNIALTGMCERYGDDDADGSRPKADLWLSMMCALGEEEANLAHLLNDCQETELDNACDSY